MVDGTSREIDERVKESLRDATSVYEVFDDVLERLAPTHILTQTQCEVCAVSLADVERALAARFSSRPAVVALEPNSLADVWSDIRRVADACCIAERGEALIAGLQARMQSIAERAGRATGRPRVACIEWQEPLMAAGNWTPEMIAMAGAVNLFGEPGRHSPWMTWDDLASADPDVIVVAPCGFDLERTASEMYWLTGNPAWPRLRAVREGRVYLADGNQYLNRPGPRVAESLEILAEILHPEIFAPSLEGAAWRRFSPLTQTAAP